MQQFVGTWIGPDEYTSEVEYTVSKCNGKLTVTAQDPSDGETADISSISFSNDRLNFIALWRSTGRIAECTIELLSNSEATLTFTYTDHARLIRKNT